MIQKTMSDYNFSTMEKLVYNLDADHSSNALNSLKKELNKFFSKSTCKDILYTENDKLFFGMRVYPVISDTEVMDILGDNETKPFSYYYIEIDSKLYDSMLNLDEKELTSILLHEVGHIVYDTATIDEVRKNIDAYFNDSGEYVNLNMTKGYRELMGYALKDSVMKIGSIFTKIGNTEIIADAFVVSCGYGPALESAINKISKSGSFLNREVDDRLITLSWVLRLRSEFETKRLPAVRTLNKAKALTSSKLEKRELDYAASVLAHTKDLFSEGSFIDNVKERFSAKFKKFKINGIRAIKDDIYELNLRLRCADTEEDLALIIRTVNGDVAILQDYLTEDIPEAERASIINTLQELYDIRQRAAKEKKVFNTTSSVINVIYPE